MCLCYIVVVLVRGVSWGMALYGTTRCSIPNVVVDLGRGMGAPVAVVFVLSHTDIVDETSVPVLAKPTPVPHLVLSFEASSP